MSYQTVYQKGRGNGGGGGGVSCHAQGQVDCCELPDSVLLGGGGVHCGHSTICVQSCVLIG